MKSIRYIFAAITGSLGRCHLTGRAHLEEDLVEVHYAEGAHVTVSAHYARSIEPVRAGYEILRTTNSPRTFHPEVIASKLEEALAK